jgi:excisionase family DNA binding protein
MASALPGQAFTDLLVLGALACQTPVALLSVPQVDGTWSTLPHGFDVRDGCNDPRLFEALASASEPVEMSDLVTSFARSPLVMPPHSMRWAYGVALRNESGGAIGVVAVLDRWLRQATKREQRAMASLARQLSAQLMQWRRPAVVPQPDSTRQPEPRAASDHGLLPPSRPLSARGAALVPERHQLLRSQEVAEIFDVTERTVINWASAGKLPSLRTIGGHLRFRRDDVMRLLNPPMSPPTP